MWFSLSLRTRLLRFRLSHFRLHAHAACAVRMLPRRNRTRPKSGRPVHGLPQAKFSYREKFGNDSAKHRDFSAVTHVAKDKGIPPFLILHVAEHPDTSAQAQRLGNVLKDAGVPVTVFGAKETSHNKINADLGLPDDPATEALFEFLGKSKVAVRREGKKQEITPPAT